MHSMKQRSKICHSCIKKSLSRKKSSLYRPVILCLNSTFVLYIIIMLTSAQNEYCRYPGEFSRKIIKKGSRRLTMSIVSDCLVVSQIYIALCLGIFLF